MDLRLAPELSNCRNISVLVLIVTIWFSSFPLATELRSYTGFADPVCVLFFFGNFVTVQRISL